MTSICARSLRFKSNGIVTFRGTNYIVSGRASFKAPEGISPEYFGAQQRLIFHSCYI
jgi:hypothetical protein